MKLLSKVACALLFAACLLSIPSAQKPAKEADGNGGALVLTPEQAKEYASPWDSPILSFGQQKWNQITIAPGSGVEKVRWSNAAGQTVTLAWDAHGILTVTTDKKDIGIEVHVVESCSTRERE